jgi:hypothetical protein
MLRKKPKFLAECSAKLYPPLSLSAASADAITNFLQTAMTVKQNYLLNRLFQCHSCSRDIFQVQAAATNHTKWKTT